MNVVSPKQLLRSVLLNPGNEGKRIRQLISAASWQFRKRTYKTPLALTLANGVKFRAYPDCVVSSSIIYADWPEYYELHFIRNLLSAQDALIDIGANVGHFSLLLADIVRPENIYAFEANPVAYSRLVENWQLNEWKTDNLYCVALGSSNVGGYIKNSSHPLTTIRISTERQDINDILVTVRALDDLFLGKTMPHVGLLKIDVEGNEKDVLLGARRFLLENRPGLIMFESLNLSVDPAIKSFLDSVGFQIFQLNPGGKIDLHRCSAQNLFAMPVESTDLLKSYL